MMVTVRVEKMEKIGGERNRKEKENNILCKILIYEK